MGTVNAAASLQRLKELSLSDEGLITINQAAKVMNVSEQRVRKLTIARNPLDVPRLKSNFNKTHKAYEIRVDDLRDFIIAYAGTNKPGRPKRS